MELVAFRLRYERVFLHCNQRSGKQRCRIDLTSTLQMSGTRDMTTVCQPEAYRSMPCNC